MGRRHQVYDIKGIAGLDYLDLYKKFTYTNQESYRLDHIAKVELGESKAGNPFDTFREWYTKDYQSFIEYNIQDVEIVDRLEDIERNDQLDKLTCILFSPFLDFGSIKFEKSRGNIVLHFLSNSLPYFSSIFFIASILFCL